MPHTRPPRIARGGCAALCLLLAAALLAPWQPPAPARAATVLLDEPFLGTTTNGSWTFGASGASAAACLSAGGGFGCGAGAGGGLGGALPDPTGSGALRLTSSQGNQAGFAIGNTLIAAGNGLDVRFDYYAYGGSGADGITFFLIDGGYSPTVAGAFGGSLGYAQRSDTGVPGLVGGYIGVGIDEYGNYANANEGRGGGCTAAIGQAGSAGRTAVGRSADYVTIRGAQFGLATPAADPSRGYCYVASGNVGSSLDTPAALTRATAARRTVHLTLNPLNILTVEIDGAPIIAPLDLDTVPGQPAFPSSFKLGFAGSTGSRTNYHEIQNLRVQALDPDLSITKAHSGAFTAGQPGSYTLQVQNSSVAGPVQASDPITVTDTLPDGMAYVGATGVGWSCGASGPLVTCAYTGAYPIAPAALLPPITLTVNITSAAPSVVNTAAVATPNEASPADNSASDSAAVAQVADLAVVKRRVTAAPQAGQPITYAIVATNNGPSSVSGASVQDSVPPEITGVSWTCAPAARCGQTSGSGNAVAVPVSLAAGESATITVSGTIADGVTGTLANSAAVAAPSGVTDPSAGNNTSTDRSPLAIGLVSFTATRQGQVVLVRWTTASEINTYGFHLWRSADGARSRAARVTPQIVPGQGRGRGGASYLWADTQAQPGAAYTYWLQEIETDGLSGHEYGPASSAATTGAGRTIFLPLAVR